MRSDVLLGSVALSCQNVWSMLAYGTFLCANREANTIFRGNSLATRCIDDMMKIVGKNYLAVTLKPVINEVRITKHRSINTRTHKLCVEARMGVAGVFLKTTRWTAAFPLQTCGYETFIERLGAVTRHCVDLLRTVFSALTPRHKVVNTCSLSVISCWSSNTRRHNASH